MTELEKARSNRYGEIDYNKLIEELHVSYSDYAKRMEESCRTGAKLGQREALAPTVNTLVALNCFVNATKCDYREIPFVVAGIGILLDLLSNYMDDTDKAAAIAIRESLACSITSVNTSFMKPNQNGGT